MRFHVIWIKCLASLTAALTVPPTNSTTNIDTVHAFGNDNYSIVSNNTASLPWRVSSGVNFPGGWHTNTKWGDTDLCVIALLVNAGHVLANEAVQDPDQPIQSAVYTVQGYEEVSIKFTTYSDVLTRDDAVMIFYRLLEEMKRMNRFSTSKWTILTEDEPVARIDFTAHPQPSRTCGASMVGSSGNNGLSSRSPLQNPSSQNGAASASVTAVSTDRLGADDDSELELSDCKWYGKSIDPWTEMISSLQILAFQDFGYRYLSRSAPLILHCAAYRLGTTFTLTAIDQDDPNLPRWTFYWVVKALGRFPKALADVQHFDWREMDATVNVDGSAVAHITLQKGLVPGPGSSNAGGGQGSTLMARGRR